jgi:hypothetical protein
MTVSFEVVSSGAMVTARVVMQGPRFTREVARLSLTRAHWEDFTRSLNRVPRNEPGRVVFAPTPPRDLSPAGEGVFVAPVFQEEAVA